MNQYDTPKSNPENKIHVADALNVEMTEDVYFSAKLQNRIRWGLVLFLSIGSFFIDRAFIGTVPAFLLSCLLGFVIYVILSKSIFPLANLTSTIKFKKFGEKLKMDKMNRKLGIGDYTKKDNE